MLKLIGVAFAVAGLFASCKSAQQASSLENTVMVNAAFHGTKDVDVDLSSAQSRDNFKLEISYQVSPNFELLIPEITAHWKYEGLLASMCQSELEVKKQLVKDAVNDNKSAKIVLHITLPVAFEPNTPKNKMGDWLDKVGRCQRSFREFGFSLRDPRPQGNSLATFLDLTILRNDSSAATSVNNVTKPIDGIYQVVIKDIGKHPSQMPSVQLPDSAFRAGALTKIHISEK